MATLEESTSTTPLWEQIKEGVTSNLEQLIPAFEDETEEERKQKLDRALEREKTFVESVLSTLKEVLNKGNQEIIILFDIDETIAVSKMGPDGKEETIIRPSLPHLLKEIKKTAGEKARIGFITSRDRKTVEDQLSKPGGLGAISSFTDKSLIFSVSSMKGEDTLEFARKLASGEELQETVSSQLVSNEPDFESIIQEGDEVKLRKLEEIKKGNPESNIVIVDDLPYPRFLNPEKNFSGVSLGEKASFFA
jgi:hypothetical protein